MGNSHGNPPNTPTFPGGSGGLSPISGQVPNCSWWTWGVEDFAAKCWLRKETHRKSKRRRAAAMCSRGVARFVEHMKLLEPFSRSGILTHSVPMSFWGVSMGFLSHGGTPVYHPF